uniref:Uncharacterized protein n=1 Tax=Caenorhabditis tropicalis TaxID=1561998 RepID=A0A1I7U5P8_9PELO
MAKPPEHQFMVTNLSTNAPDKSKKADVPAITKAVRTLLKHIKFRLRMPKITVIRYGWMKKGDDQYWVIFSIDAASAQRIQDQRKGISGRMAELNEKLFENRKEEYIKLRKYKGIQFEATIQVLRRAARYLARDCTMKDGCSVRVKENFIQISFDEAPNERISIRKLIRNYRKVFDKAVLKLSEAARRSLMEIVKEVEKNPPKDPEKKPEESSTQHISDLFSSC